MHIRSVILLTLIVCASAFVAGMAVYLQQNPLVDFEVFENYDPGQASILLDDHDQEWGRFELDRRDPVPLTEIPDCLINAFLVTEDRDFFNHQGISYRGIMRSIFANLKSGRKVQGASTITQQLVKLLYLDSQKTFTRKIKEQIAAVLIERQFTKKQILEIYLNHIYLGCGIYGVAAASKRFFGKNIQDIQPHEAATLAGVIKSPVQYCPLLCPLSSLNRRNLILKQLFNQKLIDQATYEYAVQQPLGLVTYDKSVLAPHLKETIRTFLETQVGKKQLYSGGLIIRTTLNQKIQQIANQQFNVRVKALRADLRDQIDGALMTIDTKTGEVRALIGGLDFTQSKYNRALQARRQIGSIFKPIVFAVALQNGHNFAETEIDEPIELLVNNQVWAPRNNTREFLGQMSLAKALAISNNIVPIKLLQKTDISEVVRLAQRLRLTNVVNPYLSLALGCVDVTLKEATGAFNVFANGGIYVEPHYLKWVKDRWGHKIWKKQIDREQVLPVEITSQVAKVLEISMQHFLKLFHNSNFKTPAFGKTGTTNDSRSCWFAGATPSLTTLVYIGQDGNQSMGHNTYASWTAFPIWLGLHERLKEVPAEFPVDPKLQRTYINWNTGAETTDLANPETVEIYRATTS